MAASCSALAESVVPMPEWPGGVAARTASRRRATSSVKPQTLAGTPPKVVREHGFGAFVETEFAPRLSPEEHDAYRWVSIEEAQQLLPFEGLRRTVERATRAA